MGELGESSDVVFDGISDGADEAVEAVEADTGQAGDISWTPIYEPAFGWSARRLASLDRSMRALEGVYPQQLGVDESVVPLRDGLSHLGGKLRTLGVRVHYSELGGSTDVRVPDSEAIDAWRVAQVVAEMVRLRTLYPFVRPLVLAFAVELNETRATDPTIDDILASNGAYVEQHLSGGPNPTVSLAGLTFGPIIALDAAFATDLSSKVWGTRRLPVCVPTDQPEHVAVFVHEFGHMVRYALEKFAPSVLAKVEGAVLAHLGIDAPDFDSIVPNTIDRGAPTETSALGILRDSVGIYGSQSSHELWAELFLESHSRATPRPATRVFHRALRGALAGETSNEESILGVVSMVFAFGDLDDH